MIEKLQENQNNEQQDYKILTLLRPQKHYSTALSEKKKKRKRLYYIINYAGSTERQKAATK